MIPAILFVVSILFVFLFGRLLEPIYESMFDNGDVIAPAAESRMKPKDKSSQSEKPAGTPSIIRTTMQVAISVVLLGAALVIIFQNQSNSDAQKWAFGMIGTIVGFWLKG